ncbi:hypothetical protein SEA_KEELAN_136 [Gordonia phage Keelan]|nr:hypothetical protein SEA_KEELAN_136 [Gordonia phage Keelan]
MNCMTCGKEIRSYGVSIVEYDYDTSESDQFDYCSWFCLHANCG